MENVANAHVSHAKSGKPPSAFCSNQDTAKCKGRSLTVPVRHPLGIRALALSFRFWQFWVNLLGGAMRSCVHTESSYAVVQSSPFQHFRPHLAASMKKQISRSGTVRNPEGLSDSVEVASNMFSAFMCTRSAIALA